ncbi:MULTISPECIES: bifunctional diguanylate cyclase/phosphodiesterase [Giesbergeria]|uniref:EAL domain-containing protein n=1 Tax=Giesbergeria sinuosa TaxID=80883 RepID=A0ABV9QG00_9BURK
MTLNLKSLRIHIIALLGMVMFLVMLVAVFRAYERRSSDISKALLQLQTQTDAIAIQQRQLLQGINTLANTILVNRDLGSLNSRQSCIDTLARFQEWNHALESASILTPDGEMRCSTLANQSQFRGEISRKFLQHVQRSIYPVQHDPMVSGMTEKWSLPIAVSLRNGTDPPKGILLLSFNLDFLRIQFQNNPLQSLMRMGVVDQRGTVYTHYPDPARMVGQDISQTPFHKNILEKGGRGIGEENGLDGQSRIYAFTPFIETPSGTIYVWVSVYKKTATLVANQQFQEAIFVGFILTASSFLLIWLGSEKLFLQPLAAITNAAKRLSQGDYLSRTGIPHDSSEIGQLATTFDDMALAMMDKSEILRLNRTLRVLSSVSSTIIQAKNEEDLLQKICQVIVDTGDYSLAWIAFRKNSTEKEMRIVAHYGANIDILKKIPLSWGGGEYGHGPSMRAFTSGSIELVHHLEKDPGIGPWRQIVKERGYRSVIALPLKEHGDSFGILSIYSTQTNAFSPEEVELLEKMTEELTFGISNHRAHQDRARAEELSARQRRFDLATGLPNSIELDLQLSKFINDAKRSGEELSIIILKIERVSDIQDAIGFFGADTITKQVGILLAQEVGPIYYVARISHDVFSIIIPISIEHPNKAAIRLHTLFEKPFEYSGIPIDVQITIGIALFPKHASDPDTLLRLATIATRQAIVEENWFSFYSDRLEKGKIGQLTLLSNLRKAIREGELILNYQPKVCTTTMAVTGVEALVRWKHPERGMIPPNDFIPLAEQTGLIKPLTYKVLAIAMQQAAQWKKSKTTVRIAVNISPNCLRDTNFSQRLTEMSEQFNIQLNYFDLEITETALMENPEEFREILVNLSKVGMNVFIDDFGTGYSSLAYLAKLPIHALKLDRSFIIQMDDTKHELIVANTITLAHSLGIKVVAEGVETENSVNHLKQRGCDEIQGYIYSKPLAADDFLQWHRLFQDSFSA